MIAMFCGPSGGNSSHLSLLPAAPLAVGPLEVSSGSQGRAGHGAIEKRKNARGANAPGFWFQSIIVNL